MRYTNLGESKHWLDDDVQTLQGHRPYDPGLLPGQELRKRNQLCLEEIFFKRGGYQVRKLHFLKIDREIT